MSTSPREKAARKSYQRGQTHAYQCTGDAAIGGKTCGRISGLPLDRAVREACLARLTPPTVATIREAWREARRGERAERRRREIVLHRARATEADVRHRFFDVDPAHRLVAAELEREWEAAKREVQRLERLIDSDVDEKIVFDDDAFDELMTLCVDVDAIWNAPTTTNADRKELLRTMIDFVAVEERTAESIRVRIEWVDGAPAVVVVVPLPRRADRHIRELAREGVPLHEIVRRLNAADIPTFKGRSWTIHAVREVLKRAARAADRNPVHDQAAGPSNRSSSGQAEISSLPSV
jgi:hypothetical protein